MDIDKYLKTLHIHQQLITIMKYSHSFRRQPAVSLKLIKQVSRMLYSTLSIDYRNLEDASRFDGILMLTRDILDSGFLHKIDELSHAQDALFDSLNMLISDWELEDYDAEDVFDHILTTGSQVEMSIPEWVSWDQAEIDMEIELSLLTKNK
ncbi:hypothetical protein K7432_016950 [Basidiobolus ranarum]|uniref:Uncharacterized protein n=1 Tax=Basidiobolus ranarum TaxID=34480 RepID=A0ABR2WE31_9FUNG